VCEKGEEKEDRWEGIEERGKKVNRYRCSRKQNNRNGEDGERK